MSPGLLRNFMILSASILRERLCKSLKNAAGVFEGNICKRSVMYASYVLLLSRCQVLLWGALHDRYNNLGLAGERGGDTWYLPEVEGGACDRVLLHE